MNFAPLSSDFSYWRKQTKALFEDLFWNIPEQKTNHIAVVGGNSQNFSTPVKISEYLTQSFPFKSVDTFLPDVLRSKLPPLPNFYFVKSTLAGSITKSPELETAFTTPNLLLVGDLSKNSETSIALSETLQSALTQTSETDLMNSNHPLKHCLITRDSVDSLAASAADWLVFPEIILVASMAQLQKVFRAAYYPKMIMLSQPLIPAIETLHKFTLTYPLTILTFHQENIIVAHGGQIVTTHIVDTSYSPISLWSGELAANIVALNTYNPNQPLAATAAAIFYK